MTNETVHQCPPADEAVMPCCGRTPFEVLRTDRITLDPAKVTCGVPEVVLIDEDGQAIRRPAVSRRIRGWSPRRYEYEPHALSGERRPLAKRTWLSWSGRRWLNGREYHGPLIPLGGTHPVKRQARVCPCDVCQQTNPWRVDALEYRAHAEEADRLLLTWYMGLTGPGLHHESVVHLHGRGLLSEDGRTTTTGEALLSPPGWEPAYQRLAGRPPLPPPEPVDQQLTRGPYADCSHAVWVPVWETGNTSELRFRGLVRCEVCFLDRIATASEIDRFVLGSAPPPRDQG